MYDNIDKTSYGAPSGDVGSQACYNIEEYLPGGDTGAIIATSRLRRLDKLGEHVHVRNIDIMNGVLILEKQSGKIFRRLSQPEGRTDGTNGAEEIDPGEYKICLANRMYQCKPDIDIPPDVLALVERLDGLPLALAIAGSYISRTTISSISSSTIHLGIASKKA